MRSAGILLHPSSFPSSFGIGDLGPMAFQFLDWLHGARVSVWQILPLGPVDRGGSPYCSPSAFAGNPLLISPDQLVTDGWIDPPTLDSHRVSSSCSAEPVDYERVAAVKRSLLERAFQRFREQSEGAGRREFDQFCTQQAEWLSSYAAYMALADINDEIDWTHWRVGSQLARQSTIFTVDLMAATSPELPELYDFHRFTQYLFDVQWRRVHQQAHELGIRIVGDMPMYVAHASSDVWANPELFELDVHGLPRNVAGVPPDYFSATGQLWGNPLYDWNVMKSEGYRWWVRRVQNDLERTDVVRIDHFRGFEAYWSVAAEESTAVAGQWRPGPGADLLSALCQFDMQSPHRRLFEGGALPLIAEDLGLITQEVVALRHQFGLPGMSVLQFAFAQQLPDDRALPEAIPVDTVAYTGTHDNDTTQGWFRSDIEHHQGARQRLERYGAVSPETVAWQLMRLAWHSQAALAVAPLQDVLSLGSEARMNVPGISTGNWQWRFAPELLTVELQQRLAELTAEANRLG